MNKKRNLQDKSRIVMEFINTSILLPNCVANTTYLRPPSKTGKTSSCRQANRPSQTKEARPKVTQRR